MTIAKIINIGAEQLIALPAGFHVDTEQVEIQKQENRLVIHLHQAESRQFDKECSDRQASFLAWRKKLEQELSETDYQDWQDPWADVRSKEEGREFNWDDM
ncbi:hypothetical protein [Psychrobacter sp. I-STPA10]|uniref:hypothetical protein n=1 Tax=Psychrobacter sp. I-STPA10 TaxID=2585769 RepID=UPI001E404CB5|nr:hypothetical protein [Psychrobacter sp. I-STPA10]